MQNAVRALMQNIGAVADDPIFGAAGILFVTSVGGRLYDGIAPAAPFVMIGVLNGVLGLWGWWLWRRTRD